MRRLGLLAFLLASVMACSKPAPLEVQNVWTRDTVGSTADAAIFMTIVSPTADRLVGASTAVATNTDLMTMASDGNVMEMKYLPAIDIPANKPVSLNAGGLHVWLAGLKQPLKAGGSFPLVLRFEKAGKREVKVSIVKPGAAGPNPDMTM